MYRFRLNASPFLLNDTLRHHLCKYRETDADFVQKMIDSFYVDNLVTGESTADGKKYNLIYTG